MYRSCRTLGAVSQAELKKEIKAEAPEVPRPLSKAALKEAVLSRFERIMAEFHGPLQFLLHAYPTQAS
eukprot:8215456-Alexandrium_andersonii.AAC.1